MDTLSRTVQSPLFSLLLALVTVFSVVLSFIFYFRSRRAKEPCWAIHSNNLVRDFRAKLPDLNIQYGNEEVENLTVAKVLFWNRGGGTINSDDIAEGDPLRVEATGALRILDAKILQANSPASQFKVRLDRDRNALFLEFDFLDKNHGALLQLIHSGTSSTDLVVKGTVKGGGTPKRKELPQAISRERVLYLLGVSGMWLMTLSILDFVWRYSGGDMFFPYESILYLPFLIATFWILRINPFSYPRIPLGLEGYGEQF